MFWVGFPTAITCSMNALISYHKPPDVALCTRAVHASTIKSHLLLYRCSETAVRERTKRRKGEWKARKILHINFKIYYRQSYMYIRVIVIYLFFSGASLCARTFARKVGWGGHSSTAEVALPEVWARSVLCVARGKPFELVLPWTHLRQIPGFPQHPRGLGFRIPYPCVQDLDANRVFHVEGTRTFPYLCTEHHVTILPPSSSPDSSSSLQLYARVAAVVIGDYFDRSLRCSTRLYATTSRCCCFCCFCQVVCRRKL